MGMLFVLILWAIVLIVLSLILGLITLPSLTFFAKGKGRERWFYHSSHQEYLLGYTL